MANTNPIVATVTKPATKEKTPKDADATPRVNIQDFCEEHYEDILPVIMDKIRRDKRKEVHARLDFGESPKKMRIKEGSQNSSARTLSARRRDPSGVERSYDNTRSSYGTGTKHGYHSRDRGRSHYVKIGRESESPLSRVSESGTSGGGHWKSKSKRHKSTDEDDLAVPCICEEEGTEGLGNAYDGSIFQFTLIGPQGMVRGAPSESIDWDKDLQSSLLSNFMQQKKYVKILSKSIIIKQKDGETFKGSSWNILGRNRIHKESP
ncbi:hypothetical protein Tco_0757294 [Tanacetum coccineum]